MSTPKNPSSRTPPTRETLISKKLSSLLRHNALKENLTLVPGGYINLSDILSTPTFRSLKVTFSEIQQVVQQNSKQRFTLVPASPSASSSVESGDPRDWLIRANQGHSMKVVADEDLLQRITREDVPEMVVHGTSRGAWRAIVASGGLKPMGRNHVHFATGLPAGWKSGGGGAAATDRVENDGDVEGPKVISGMRNSATVLIFVDVRRAMDAGVGFWRSENGVVLSQGDERGLVPLEFFRLVEDRLGKEVLMVDGKVVQVASEGPGPT